VATGFGEAAGFSKEDEQALPSIMWVDAAAVAKAAVDGLARGRLVVIPGMVNRIASVFATVTPRSALLPILRRGHPSLK
jgi:short-subunit dehydrogenase